MNTLKRTLHLMGTVIQITVTHPDAATLLDHVEQKLLDYQKRFSANDASSDLMQVNNHAGISAVKLDSDLFELIAIGKRCSLSNAGSLNIAIGPLIQAWRIGFKDAQLPSQQQIASLLPLTDPNKILLDEQSHSVMLADKGMAIDLGALAKGYFADQIAKYLTEQKVQSALIDLGGNVVVVGDKLDDNEGYFTIGVQNPFLPRGNYVAVIKAKNQSIVTSGIYERQAVFNGKTYHHIFDSHTGYPIETTVASITIVSKRSLDGEIWTTQFYGKPAQQIILALNKMPDVEGLVITTDGRFACSSGLPLVN